MPGFCLSLALPGWIATALPPPDACLHSVEERMDLTIRLAQENVRRGTGRPVVVAAFDADIRAAGFDEGDTPTDWPRMLARRAIIVTQDVRRAQAVVVLAEYARGGGPIHNSGIAGADAHARSSAPAMNKGGVGPRRP